LDIFELYERTVAQYINSKPNQLVVDVGGGKSCPFAAYKEPAMKAKISAVDVCDKELKHNTDVDDKRVANIKQVLQYESEEADLLVSRSVLEHLRDVERFVINSKRV
jgi:ubiquinone/menaquinone biosynthesis C-methylase UbiE